MNIIPQPLFLEYRSNQSAWNPEIEGVLPDDPLTLHELLNARDDIIYILEPCAENPSVQGEGRVPFLSRGQHQITVDSQGVTVNAQDDAGLFWASQSLGRLIRDARSGDGAVSACIIEDEALYHWRGFMLDCCRFFQPVKSILEIIDIMAGLKMNVLHLHLSDDQGWRLEIPEYPRLCTVGGKRPNSVNISKGKYTGEAHEGFYTGSDIRHIVNYAAKRHIMVVPEIDMPGHSVAALASYPKLGCSSGPFEVRIDAGISTDILCLGSKATEPFVKAVLKTVSELFPSPWIHIGGDEVPKKNWKSCPKCAEYRQKRGIDSFRQQQTWFTNYVSDYLNTLGKTAVVWSEICSSELNPDIAGQYWLPGKQSSYREAGEGRHMIFSAHPHCYLDMSHAYVSLKKAYSYNPLAGEKGVKAAPAALGIEATLWTEWTPSRERLYRRLFPRLHAIAEAAWTSAERRDFVDFLPRLESHIQELEARGFPVVKKKYWFPGPLAAVRSLFRLIFDLGMDRKEGM